MRDGQTLGLVNIYSVISEMRTPLLELKMLSEAGNLEASREVAKQTLGLFDSFLYVQKLENKEIDNLNYLPHSLIAVTEDILDKLSPFAKLYGVNLEFKVDTPKKLGVSLVKKAFDHATHSLLYSLISSLQNKTKTSLKIRAVYSGEPVLKFFSRDIDRFFNDKSILDFLVRSKLNPQCSGIGSGLLLANSIYQQTGSKLSFVSNQHGRGLGVNFRSTRQMSLVESLV